MVTCLSETCFRETCYHFGLIFAKLFTVARFSRKRRFRKSPPLSTIFRLNRENRYFRHLWRKWRLRWNLMNLEFRKNRDFSRFLRSPATSRGKFTTFAKISFLATSSLVLKWPRYCGQKMKGKTLLWRVFPLKKIFGRRAVSIKKATPDWDETTSKNGHFWPFLRPKLRLVTKFWPKNKNFRKNVTNLTKKAFVSALCRLTYVAIATRPLFYSWRLTVFLLLRLGSRRLDQVSGYPEDLGNLRVKFLKIFQLSNRKLFEKFSKTLHVDFLYLAVRGRQI